jgi:hypothetical protein
MDDETLVQKLINNCDVEGARAWVREHERFYKALLHNTYHQDHTVDVAMHMIYHGSHSVMNVQDVVGNWNLRGRWAILCRSDGKSFSSFSDGVQLPNSNSTTA